MISKIEIINAAKEFPDVGVAFEDAVNSCIKYASEARRCDWKPGLWGRAKLACLQFNYAHRPSQVLSIYRDAIRVARPISDLDSLATIIIDEAEFRVLPDGEQHRWIGDDRGNILIETISFYASDPAAAILIPCKPHLAFEYNPFA